MANIYSVSLGCPKNRVDTERLLASVPGVSVVPDFEDACCIVINTCAFIDPAVRESVSLVAETIEDIAENVLKVKPLLVVAGCLVGRYGEKTLAGELPEVDLWLDNRDMASWAEKLAGLLEQYGFLIPGASCESMRILSTGPSYAWLKISDGCDHACSFCTIPSIRGTLRSSFAEALRQEAEELLRKGVKELVLVGQDVTAWGKDFAQGAASGKGLVPLLESLLPLSGLERLRLMYLYPAGLTRELLLFLRDAGKPFVPYFDIPLQHAHPDVLSRMGRPFARDPAACVDRVREYFPEAALRTSFIVGFPGETDAHFQALYDFVAEVKFHHLGVFSFYAEEGAKAAAMPDQVDEAVKEERRAAIMELQAEISERILADYAYETLEVLVDAPHPEWPGLFMGRTWFQAPEIDGATYVSGPGVAAGTLVTAEITETGSYDLTALV